MPTGAAKLLPVMIIWQEATILNGHRISPSVTIFVEVKIENPDSSLSPAAIHYYYIDPLHCSLIAPFTVRNPRTSF